MIPHWSGSACRSDYGDLRELAAYWHPGDVIRRWGGAPHWIRRTVLLLVTVLIYGTAVHAVQLPASGLDPYPELPRGLRIYFTALLVLDPSRCRAAGTSPPQRSRSLGGGACSDAVANGIANYALDPAGGVTAGRLGQAVITVLAIGACAATPALWRSAFPRRTAVERPGTG